jgi:hypothetical protein
LLIISDASLFSDSSEVETNHIVGFDLVSSISFCQILDVNIIIEFLKYPVFQSQNVTFHSSKIHKRDWATSGCAFSNSSNKIILNHGICLMES